MKLLKKLFVIFLMVNLFISCTQDNSVEEGLQFKDQNILNNIDNETPIDNDRVR